MRIWGSCLITVACTLFVACSSEEEAGAPSSVIELTDATFEHLTQAATGATTGDWFVKFYTPWCGHCKRLSPDWDTLASELKSVMNVAKVDCTANRATCDRFAIRGYPTLLLFHHGTYYKHQGNRAVENLKAFATEEYSKSEGTAIPRANLTIIEKITAALQSMPAETLQVYESSKVGFFSVFIAGVLGGAVLKGLQQRCLRCKSEKKKRE